jgi:hypothetical protein
MDMKKRNSTRWPDLMPEPWLMIRNPVLFVKQYAAVWRLNAAEDQKMFQEKVDRETEDLKKARMFRKAHGLPETTGLAAKWGLGLVEDEEDEEDVKKRQEDEEKVAEEKKSEGKKRKVLFGIWEV